MTRNQYKVCFADLVDPIQQQLPQKFNSFADSSLAFKRGGLDFALISMCGSPPSNSHIREFDGGAGRLAEDRTNQGGGEVAMDTNCDGAFDPWWVSNAMEMC